MPAANCPGPTALADVALELSTGEVTAVGDVLPLTATSYPADPDVTVKGTERAGVESNTGAADGTNMIAVTKDKVGGQIVENKGKFVIEK